MAEESILRQGIDNRKRPKLSLTDEIDVKDIMEPGSIDNIMNITTEALSGLQETFHNHLKRIEKTIIIQDEELQLLWWMVGEQSTMWGNSFSDIDEKSRPILLAIEAASMTEEFIEPPSLKAVFSRVGISNSSKVTIPDAINSCGEETLKKINNEIKKSSIIFPVHIAAERALETGVNASWIDGWSSISDITKNTELNHQQLALQVYRECKFISQFLS
ncbi:GTPase-associated system all-helical protein GASH [Desulfogranum marinum]|uniref:GTPase-associated system all-helical protein GASH n=1 Tax=Desulfogranum marinum TaxID=453220 RepID=UPI0019622D0D|nr:GTPase-associated system all-helical protein GASH [Desulfogranum marinum]MBM9514280.1 hypothetical protein [Desulfogranum marinum]